MNYSNLIFSVIILMLAGFLYNKLQIKIETNEKQGDLDVIKKYFLNEQEDNYIRNLTSIKKPILWIHIDYKKNSRSWDSFYSRSNNDINQDYLYLTIRSAINNCGDDFHICLIDDNSFSKLLDNWDVDLSKISEPNKNNLRNLAICKLLYTYGGIYLENSFIMFRSIKDIYNNVEKTGKMVVAEFKSNASNNYTLSFQPCLKFIGCIKNCEEMYEIIKEQEILNSKDLTNNSIFEGKISNLLFEKVNNNYINYIDGKFIGTRDIDNREITLDILCGSSFMELDNSAYCLYIPRDDIEKRTNYNWFLKLSIDEVLNSNTNIGKYLLISN